MTIRFQFNVFQHLWSSDRYCHVAFVYPYLLYRLNQRMMMIRLLMNRSEVCRCYNIYHKLLIGFSLGSLSSFHYIEYEVSSNFMNRWTLGLRDSVQNSWSSLQKRLCGARPRYNTALSVYKFPGIRESHLFRFRNVQWLVRTKILTGLNISIKQLASSRRYFNAELSWWSLLHVVCPRMSTIQ